MGFGDEDATARLRPSTSHHFLEHLAIDLAHDFRRAHETARASGHYFVGLDERRACPVREEGAGHSKPRMRNYGWRIGNLNTGLMQSLPRQIQPPNAGILVDVAQDVRELQRAAEMVR